MEMEKSNGFKELKEPNSLEELGTDNEYPLLNMNRHNCFNFKNFIENK